MGLDVYLYAVGEVAEARISEADALIRRSELVLSSGVAGNEVRVLSRELYYPERIELRTPYRYYGPGYERGCWPLIYGAIRVLQAALPECTVYYCADSSDTGEECTHQMLEDIWQHYLGPTRIMGGDP